MVLVQVEEEGGNARFCKLSCKVMPLPLLMVSYKYHCHIIHYHTIKSTITYHTMPLPLPFHAVSYHYYCISIHHIITSTITITYCIMPLPLQSFFGVAFIAWELCINGLRKKHDQEKPMISTSDMKYS